VLVVRSLAGLLFGTLLVACSAQERADLAIWGVALVDVSNGTVADPSDLYIKDGSIIRVSPTGLWQPDATEVIDARQAYAVPSFVDLFGGWNISTPDVRDEHATPQGTLDEFTRYGVGASVLSTAFDRLAGFGGGDGNTAGGVPAQVFAGPHLLINTGEIEISGGDHVVDSAEGGRAAVRRLASLGGSVVHVVLSSYAFGVAEEGGAGDLIWTAVADEARILGVTIFVVLSDLELAETALRELPTVIEYCGQCTNSGWPTTGLVDVARTAEAAGIIFALRTPSGTSFSEWVAEPCTVSGGLNLGRPEPLFGKLKSIGVTPPPPGLLNGAYSAGEALAANGLDVIWATANDGLDETGYSLIGDIRRTVRSGVEPSEALRAYAIKSAEALRIDGKLGLIAVGRPASFLVVEGNPLDDISHLLNVRAAISGAVFLESKRSDGEAPNTSCAASL
jgi:hypothetical protein